jgi:hypothetical protein
MPVTSWRVRSPTMSRMLWRCRARRARPSGDSGTSSMPKSRSKTERGFVSAGMGVVAERHEMLLV